MHHRHGAGPNHGGAQPDIRTRISVVHIAIAEDTAVGNTFGCIRDGIRPDCDDSVRSAQRGGPGKGIVDRRRRIGEGIGAASERCAGVDPFNQHGGLGRAQGKIISERLVIIIGVPRRHGALEEFQPHLRHVAGNGGIIRQGKGRKVPRTVTANAFGLQHRRDVGGIVRRGDRIQRDEAAVRLRLTGAHRSACQKTGQRIRQVILGGGHRAAADAIVNGTTIKNGPAQLVEADRFGSGGGVKGVGDKLRPVMENRQVNAERVGFGHYVRSVVRRIGIDHPENDSLGRELVAQRFDGGNKLRHVRATVAGEDQHHAFDGGVVLEIVERTRDALVIDQPEIIREFRCRAVNCVGVE